MIDVASWQFLHYYGQSELNLNGWRDPSDRILTGDYDGDGDDELILFNVDGATPWGAIAVVDLATGQFVNSLAYTPWIEAWLSGWRDANDRALIADHDGDGRDDLVLINDSLVAGAIHVIDLMTFTIPVWHDHSGLGLHGWLDSYDRVLAEDVNSDGRDDLVLYNRGLGAALRVLDIPTGATLAWHERRDLTGALR